jgi:hypothetical protein
LNIFGLLSEDFAILLFTEMWTPMACPKGHQSLLILTSFHCTLLALRMAEVILKFCPTFLTILLFTEMWTHMACPKGHQPIFDRFSLYLVYVWIYGLTMKVFDFDFDCTLLALRMAEVMMPSTQSPFWSRDPNMTVRSSTIMG